jgi:glucosamine--fructose-6-phosphate aminotransferase (isomerizing)
MISRSGLTSEVVRAAQFLEEERDIRTVAITCTKGQPLENISTETIQLDFADEKSTVMTRSFTSMLLALQYLAASVASSGDFQRALRTLPSQAEPLLGHFAPKLKSFVESRSFEDHVVLAQGPLFGIASEAMLKITECSSSYAQVFHTMEFRHGPKSIVSPETLIVFLLSESSYDAEVEVLEEMRSLGASTLVIGNVLDERARKASELSIEMLLTVPEYARLAAYLLWGQLYGTYTGLKKGLNPDNPRNLSRVVVLNDNN